MIPENIKGLMVKLEESGFESYIIGGAVRDELLGITPKDYDIFTNASGEEILKIFPTGKVIGGDERQAKILTVIVDGVEISSYRLNGDRTETGNTLLEHVNTCDFSINALAENKDGEITDLVNGLSDLTNGILRFVGKPQDRITEDPLRILRYVRFILKYNLQRDFGSDFAICANAVLLNTIPKERIMEELKIILTYPEAIDELSDNGILQIIIPEFARLEKLGGGTHHNETVDEHSILSFEVITSISNNPLLALAAFLHDIGKADANEDIQDDGQIHFYEHEAIGAELAETIMDRLKFSTDEIKYVKTLIARHMFSYKERPSKRSYTRFFDELNKANIPIEDYIMLVYADNQANLKKPRIKFGDFMKGSWLYQKYNEMKYSKEPFNVKDLKIDGHDVMGLCGAAGKKVGEILQEVMDKVMDGELTSERHILLGYLKTRNGNRYG